MELPVLTDNDLPVDILCGMCYRRDMDATVRRVVGIEASASWRVTTYWTILGALTHIKVSVTESIQTHEIRSQVPVTPDFRK